jgi:hypothetical protein
VDSGDTPSPKASGADIPGDCAVIARGDRDRGAHSRHSFSPPVDGFTTQFLANNPSLTEGGWKRTNVQYRQAPGLLLADGLPTKEETQRLSDEKCGLDHFVIETAQSIPRARPSADHEW